MKNIEAGVDVIHIQEKKEEVEEEKNKKVTNVVRFYLKDDPRFEISAMGLWCENSRGEKVGYVDIYFFRTNRQNQKAYTEQVDSKNKLYNIQDKQNTKYEL